MKGRLSDVINEMQELKIAAARVEDTVPRGLRFAEYPDGSRRLQGGYAWSQGALGGVVWRDLPVVAVDARGQEIPA